MSKKVVKSIEVRNSFNNLFWVFTVQVNTITSVPYLIFSQSLIAFQLKGDFLLPDFTQVNLALGFITWTLKTNVQWIEAHSSRSSMN